MTAPTPEEGFTLLETSAALLVTGLAVAVGYAGLALLSDVRDEASAANTRVVQAANARATLEGWLRSSMVLVEADPRSTGGTPRHRMIFVTADGGPIRPGPRRVRLRVDLDPGTPERGLVADIAPAGGRGGETLILAPEATGLEIAYRVRDGGRLRWTARWQEERRLPEAVRLRLLDIRSVRLGPGAGRGARTGLPALLRRPVTVSLAAGRQ